MNVIFSARAERDLDDILDDITAFYPASYAGFQSRLHDILQRIGRWPEAAQRLESHPGVRMVAMIQYPYNLFYAVEDGTIEILHIMHGARAGPPLDPA